MKPVVVLQPGGLAVGNSGEILRTVLGSCIAVCIYDQVKRAGGMNHFVLPKPMPGARGKLLKSAGENQEDGDENRYAEFAIPNLLRAMKLTYGSKPQDLIVKLVGGAHFVDNGEYSSEIGKINRDIAHELLAKFGLKVSAENVGGSSGKEVEFSVSDGAIRVKSLTHRAQSERNIRVMIIDDSMPARKVIRKIIEQDPSIKVVAEAQDPIEAMAVRKTVQVDVITLDINMPKMDGVTYLKQYMLTDPIPTIMVTDYNLDSSGPVFEALESGALDYAKKPALKDLEDSSHPIIDLVKAAYQSRNQMAKVRVQVKPQPNSQLNSQSKTNIQSPSFVKNRGLSSTSMELLRTLVVVGASTGGTEAIRQFLSLLPAEIPPILIVQHIPPVFSKAFAERLNSLFSFQVKEAEHGDLLEPGRVYIAPGGCQMGIKQLGKALSIEITDDAPVNRFKPSVDYLFKSVTRIKETSVFAVLMTGMGADGARGMHELKGCGYETIAQDEATSVVFGMPKAAIELGAATHVVALDQIAAKLFLLIGNSKNKSIKCN